MFDGLFEKLYEMTAIGAFVDNPGYLLMLLISFVLLYLGIVKKYEPLLLIPIGFGVLLANLPGADLGIVAGEKIELGVDENGRMMYMNLFEIAHEYGILNFLYYALIKTGLLPPLIFLGVGAMTDFGPMLRNLKLALFGGAAQFGIFAVLLIAMASGAFTIKEAASLAIIGGADGPTAIFTTIKLAPHLLGPIAIAAYSYMALVP
ncbi:MAG: sodium ion-translocating decarboxylase subunit beta, partial [Bacteroidales bacterium]|nr:sodium ion-translocating decarboxylase subunit beta [Bacteroidales bacterium]